MSQNSRLYFHGAGLNLEFWHDHEHFINEHMNNELWFIEREKTLRIGFAKPLFERVDIYYDGHTVKGFTFLGLSVTWSYSYHSRNIDQVRKDLEAEASEELEKSS